MTGTVGGVGQAKLTFALKAVNLTLGQVMLRCNHQR